MTATPKNDALHVPVDLMLDLTQRIFSYGKTPLAIALIYFVLEQFPEHRRARVLLRTFTSSSGSEIEREEYLQFVKNDT